MFKNTLALVLSVIAVGALMSAPVYASACSKHHSQARCKRHCEKRCAKSKDVKCMDDCMAKMGKKS